MRRTSLRILSFALVAAVAAGFLSADEGQWLPEQIRDLDWPALRERGLELSPDEVWDGGGGLLSAAVNLSGCSASFVSEDGLIVTNHHCGYRAINAHSTPETNRLRDGFLAATRAEELPAAGYRVSIVRRYEDVTAVVHAAQQAAGPDPAARWRAVQETRERLVEEGEREPHTSVIVVSYFEGREWRRIYRTELRDVRLVYAPPAAIGEYGGEEDNWMWPRHTGDFTFFRAYVAPDGTPAEYAEENVPYHPPRWLEVSTEGVAEGDLVMILGYPGRTNRYLSSIAVAARETYFYPMRRKVFGGIVEALERHLAGDEARYLEVASTIKSFNNVLKNADGMIWGLARNAVVERKQREETEFQRFVERSPRRQKLYGTVLEDLLELDRRELARQEHDFVLDQLARRSLLMREALQLAGLHLAVAAGKGPPEDELRELMERGGGPRGRRLDAERDILALLLEDASSVGLDGAERPIAVVQASCGLDTLAAEPLAREIAGTTRVASTDFRVGYIQALLAGEKPPRDPLVVFAGELLPLLEEQAEFRAAQAGARLDVGSLWIQAQEEWRGQRFYPDANGTLRVSIASVKAYEPRDGVLHTPFTTVAGVVAKHRDEAPFDVPEPLLEAAREEGARMIPVCFLADGDTTGGNSGSPVVDGKGRLVGLNFDRVFENVSGDFGWKAERSRNISVDMRYVLWLMREVYPAPNLLEEMELREAF